MLLKRIPAFGFETDRWGAFEIHKDIARKALSVRPNVSPQLPIDVIAKRSRMLQNVRKILEYIPFVGIFVGLLGLGDFALKEERQNLSVHFVERHLIAVSGFGFLILPICDLIAQCVRSRQLSPV